MSLSVICQKHPPDQSATTRQSSNDAGFSEDQNATEKNGVAFRDPRKASNGAGCRVVADRKPGNGTAEENRVDAVSTGYDLHPDQLGRTEDAAQQVPTNDEPSDEVFF